MRTLSRPFAIALVIVLTVVAQTVVQTLSSASMYRRALASHASCVPDWRAVVCFTTSPERVGATGAMLRSIFAQSVYDPSCVRIVAAFPRTFRGVTCVWPDRLPSEYSQVQIIEVDDVGPATKVVHAGARAGRGEIVISVDDDHVYGPQLLGSLIGHHLFVDRTCVWSSESRWFAGDRGRPTLLEYRCHTRDCNGRGMLLGFGGVLYPPAFFTDDVVDRFRELAGGPCRLCDDVTLTALARERRVPIRGAHVWPPWYLDGGVSSTATDDGDRGSALQVGDIREPLAHELARYTPVGRLLVHARRALGKLGLVNSNSLRYQECMRSLSNGTDLLRERPTRVLR